METNNIDREQWLDVAKFLGIVAVFVGHFGELAGGSYRFVYLYQNALFFFCAGYLHSKKQYDKFSIFFIRKCKRLLLPGFAFSLLVFAVSTLFQVLSGTVDTGLIRESIMSILLLKGLGLGNWFFTGLLSVSVVFEIINRNVAKLCGNGGRAIVLLIVCGAMWCVPDSMTIKLQFCNLSSIFAFSIYYALGNFLNVITNQRTMMRRKDTKWKHVMGMVALALSVYLYFLCLNVEVTMRLIPTVIIIMANLYIAKILEKCTLLAKWGTYTMHCCGNEYIIRHAFDKVVHLNDWIFNDTVLEITCWILAIVFIWIIIYFIYPLENYFIKNSKDLMRFVNVKK